MRDHELLVRFQALGRLTHPVNIAHRPFHGATRNLGPGPRLPDHRLCRQWNAASSLSVGGSAPARVTVSADARPA
jgi:hypothetical protein